MEFVESTESQEAPASAYILAPGVRVRKERSGLLFYHRAGPRLYFLSSGNLLTPQFFVSKQSVAQWSTARSFPWETSKALEKALAGLERKGVVCACKAGT
ncbi:MAG TPA: mycofactocin biosynthesis chaperone MftB [Desulfomonilaceae bacterium]|nr:mycofactocin biosynthesis chaperone MftB [Desulfomonilaceae bacterium]